MILLLFVMSIVNLFSVPVPGCTVTARYAPAPGLSTPYTGVGFRYISVSVKGLDCGDVSVRLANYGGRFPGEEILLKSGDTVTVGPVPMYRTVERVLENGKVFNIPLKRKYP